MNNNALGSLFYLYYVINIQLVQLERCFATFILELQGLAFRLEDYLCGLFRKTDGDVDILYRIDGFEDKGILMVARGIDKMNL